MKEKETVESVEQERIEEVKFETTTKCDHHWTIEGTQSGMTSCLCHKCWSGCQFSPGVARIEDGKIVWEA